MRKTLNIILALSIFSSYSLAGIMEEAQLAITPASTLEITDASGHTVSTAYYSGGGSVKFDFSEPPQPFLTFTPPSIEAGCNGIDLKGMFFNLLGIDQMGEMIQNAGASLAYGVAVGLIYSLPGIKEAFDFIREWANKIQQLLANACSSGIQIGMALGESTGANLRALKSKVNESVSKTSNEMAGYLQKGISGLMEAFDIGEIGTSTVPPMLLSEKNQAIVDLFKGALQSDTSILGIIMTDLATKTKASSAVFEDMFVIKAAERAVKVTSSYIVADSSGGGTLGDDDYSTGIDDIANLGSGSLTGKDTIRLNLFAYVLVYNYIGDIGITAPDDTLYESIFAIDDNSGSSATEDQRASSRDSLISATRSNFIKRSVMGPGAKMSAKTGGRNLAKFIWMGTSAAANRDAGRQPGESGKFAIKTNGKLAAPKVTIYTISLDNTPKKAYVTMLSSNSDNKKPFFPSDAEKQYKGVLDQSTCIVDKLVDGNGTITGCGSVPFVYPEMHKYIKVIKNSPIYEKPRLKNVLTLSMAANMANALLYSIDNSFGNLSASQSKLVKEFGTGGVTEDTIKQTATTAQGGADLMMALIAKKGEAMAEANKIIRDELSGGFELKTKIEGIFTAQAIKNRERGLKSLQK
jgi:hypothetical protein